MITIQKKLDLPDTYPLDRIGPVSDILFFDIETTGFSGDYSNLYLIGCTYYQDDCWNLIQWFADTKAAESELLDRFFSFLGNYKILIHFNGDGFDIPYLLKRCKHLKKNYDFSGIESVDIYKKIKPYKKLLGLESMKQKAIEQFLKVTRTDQFSGGELIDVYHRYLKTQDPSLYDLLLLHNEDDLKGMPTILPILNYPDFLEHSLTLESQNIMKELYSDGTISHSLELVCKSSFSVPVSFSSARKPVFCQVCSDTMTLTVQLYEGTLRHFYPNYKDYYYFPQEDQAVHKSFVSSSDKNKYTKAAAKNCYTRETGIFLPQFEQIWEPALKEELKDKSSYVSLSDVCLKNPDCFNSYLKQLLTYLGVK